MKVYVGTYGKYNNGSICGEWVDLDKYENYEDFVAECRRIHKDEAEPEFMVQDVETDGEDWQSFSGESLSDYKDYWTLKKEFSAKQASPSVTVTENTEKNGIEIRFAEKPSPSVIAELKANRWRWSRFGGCWYNFANEENRAFAKAIAGGAPVPNPSVEKSAPSQVQSAIKALEENAKQSLAEYRAWLVADPKRIADIWKHDVEGHMKDLVGAVRLDNGSWLKFDKPTIKTSYCHGEDDRGQGDEGPGTIAFAEKCCAGFRSEIGFKNHNHVKSQFNEGRGDVYAYPCFQRENWRVVCGDGRARLETVQVLERYRRDWKETTTEVSEKEWKAIRSMEAWRAISMRRRVNAYWKRFGSSKLRTWTYWTEA